MDLTEKINLELRRLPEPLAWEVLEFIEYLEYRHGLCDQEGAMLKRAQGASMHKIWDNPRDEVWNEL